MSSTPAERPPRCATADHLLVAKFPGVHLALPLASSLALLSPVLLGVIMPSLSALHSQPCLGWSIAVCAVAAWVVVVYTTLVAKAMPVTGWAVLDWVRADTFFCHLLPMLLPTLVLFRYWSWYSLESFKNT
ncbi:unnamed protein product [Prorocentrum cordatum]|uniref:Glycerophosphocholine acyltransferase 1 n=1 Tax=Prorocentrum cordatum TaxID=2364126 RepID=A0ABN9PJ50_9DINO|nr:unnamed protein product [Polarella glacialis]